MRVPFVCLIALVIACGAAPPVTANPAAHLSGHVDFGGCGGTVHATGSAPCSYVAANGALVVLTDVNGHARDNSADATGRYEFAVPAGRYSLVASLVGWSPPSSPYPSGVRINAQSSAQEILLTSGVSVTENLVITYSPD